MLNIEYMVLVTVSRNMGTFKYGWVNRNRVGELLFTITENSGNSEIFLIKFMDFG